MTEALTQIFLTPTGWLLVIFGTGLGVFVGAIPGLTGTMLIALTLPLTFGMDEQYAMTLLISIYVGAISGGMISATLLRMPGTPASIVTTFDGYPMARDGQPERALGLGVMSSIVGGLISWFFLFLLAKPISQYSKEFGPFDYFSLVMMALVLIATIGGKSLSRSLFAGFLGILFALVGINPATGQTRLTFGYTELNNGFGLLPVLIGMFAVNQIFQDIILSSKTDQIKAINTQGLAIRLKDFQTHWINLIRSSLVGTWIGLLPGIGANIGSVTAYSVAKSTSKSPEQFGNGCEDGIVAAEAANNATVGGALIPLVAMGLPGSVVEAVLLGALIIHGFQPGPRLFDENPAIVYSIIFACLFANIVMAVIMCFSMKILAKLTVVPRAYLIPVIIAFCVVGSYALSNRLFDVWVMIGFGLLGFFLESRKIPLAPFVIGFVLGPIAEENLSAGLMSSNGDWSPVVTEPKSLLFLVVAAILLFYPLYRGSRKQKQETDS
ncbi:MAG: tripartite tricarboxylate transporter permease [Planctomycetota bacterium]